MISQFSSGMITEHVRNFDPSLIYHICLTECGLLVLLLLQAFQNFVWLLDSIQKCKICESVTGYNQANNIFRDFLCYVYLMNMQSIITCARFFSLPFTEIIHNQMFVSPRK